MPNCDAGLVSVLMSVYNGAPTLEKAAASVLAQTYRNLELILCDDASTDDTWRIMRALPRRMRASIFKTKQISVSALRSTSAFCARAGRDTSPGRTPTMFPTPTGLSGRWTFCSRPARLYAACGVRVFDDTGVWSTRQFPQKITEAHHRAEESLLPPDDALPPRRARERERLQHLSRNARRTEDL